MRTTMMLAATAATLLMPLTAAAANHTMAKAELTIAGTHVLTVASAGQFNARDRIRDIERRLARILRVEKPTAFDAQPQGIEPYSAYFDVTVATIKGQPTLMLMDTPLATVTAADAAGRPAEEVATEWEGNLSRALQALQQARVGTLEEAMKQVQVAYDGRPMRNREQIGWLFSHGRMSPDQL